MAYNPVVVSAKLLGRINDIPYELSNDGGWSRGWDGSLAPEISGAFTNASMKTSLNNTNFKLTFRYVNTDFRLMEANKKN